MKLSTGVSTALDTVIEYFERLGICIAVFAGGAAIVKYSKEVLPFWPLGAVIVGVILTFASIFLALLVAGEYFSKHASSLKNRFFQIAMAIIVVVVTIFFVLSGGYAGIASLKS